MKAPTGLEFVAADILIEQCKGSYQVWLTQNGHHYPFPNGMEFDPDNPIVNLESEGYISASPCYNASNMELIRAVEAH